MTAERIALVLGPYDPFDYEILPAYFADATHAFYVAEGILWLRQVRQDVVNPELYIGDNRAEGINVSVEIEGEGFEWISLLIERWRNTSALDLLINEILPGTCPELGLSV